MHNKRKRSASRESSVKLMRSSSRNSNRSASSDGPKSFEEMARGILAGTLCSAASQRASVRVGLGDNGDDRPLGADEGV